MYWFSPKVTEYAWRYCVTQTLWGLTHILPFLYLKRPSVQSRDHLFPVCKLISPTNLSLLFFSFLMESCSCHPGWTAVVWSPLTATSASWVQAILPAWASCVAWFIGTCHHAWLIFVFVFLFIYLWDGVSLCCPGWSIMVWSQLTKTSASWVQAILLSQPPE